MTLQLKLSQSLQKVGDSGDLEIILHAERFVLDNERTYYTDTPIMEESLDNALEDIDIALELVEIQCKILRRTRQLPTPINDPDIALATSRKIEARQFFKSHQTRLKNQETAPSIGLDKVLIEVRMNNLNVASGEYIKLQKIALDGPLSGQESVPEVNRNIENRR